MRLLRFAILCVVSVLTALVVICAANLFSQTSGAVFNGNNANFKSMTIGPSHAYVWAKLPQPWPVVAACYDAVGTLSVEGFNPAEPHRAVPGGCNTIEGSFTWLFSVNAAGGVDWQLVGTPVGGTANFQKGTF